MYLDIFIYIRIYIYNQIYIYIYIYRPSKEGMGVGLWVTVPTEKGILSISHQFHFYLGLITYPLSSVSQQ